MHLKHKYLVCFVSVSQRLTCTDLSMFISLLRCDLIMIIEIVLHCTTAEITQ